MKKLTKLLSIFAMASAIAGVGGMIAGCSSCNDEPAPHTHDYVYKSDGESGHHQECKDGDDVLTTTPHNFGTDDVCDDCGYKKTEQGEDDEHTYDDTKWDRYDWEKHYHTCTDEGCDEEEGKEHEFDENYKCTVCGAELGVNATFELVPSDLDAKAYDSNYNVGIYTILSTTKVRTRARENYDVYDLDGNIVESGFTASKSVQFDGTNRGIGINAPAPGKLSLYLDNGSSGLGEGDFQTLVLTKPDGTTETLSYPAKKLRLFVLDLEEAGNYTITRGSGGTTDIYFAKFEALVRSTPVESMKVVSAGTTEYYIGQDLDLSQVQVQITHVQTKMVEPVALDDPRLKIDTSKFDKTVAGTYEIVVTFTDEDGNVFTDKFEVTVSGVKELEIGLNKIVQGNNGYNGVYENVAVKQFYFVGDKIDLTGLSVYTILSGSELKSLVTEGYTTNVSSIDMNTAGVKEVVIKWGDSDEITASFTIYVAAKPTVSGDTVNVKVDGSLSGEQVGSLNEGAYQFKNIQQSLEFLGALELDDNVLKVITLAEGTYNEKVEVKLPNVTIKGTNTDATKTVIEYDALYGETDESGFTHTTDSTATLNVRVKAVGFVIENVTISNAWNSTAYFDEHKGAGYNEHRALAALFQADKVVVDNCRLLGYQDTVEFFTGRQYVLNTFIQGRTDFIFGTNNTTYFYNCEIHSIVSSGYLTAFKGNNKDAKDAVLYGAIFDHCKFTAAEGVTVTKYDDEGKLISSGDTAIGRPWGAYAAVAVINSELGGHISLAASSGKSAGERYVAMSNNNPYDANVKFVEYNNTGDGAIDEEVKGMKMLSAEDAAKYSNLSIIFGTTNGGVTYTSAWDGSKGVQITEKTYRFSDYYTSGDAYNTYHEADNESLFGGDATVTGKWGHELNQSKDHAKFDADSVITFTIKGKVTVTTYGSAYGLPENVIISYKNGYATLTIVKTASSPIANGCYITSITLDKSDVPVDSEIEYSFVGGTEDISGTLAEPASIFDGDIKVVGFLRNNNNSYEVKDGTVLTFTRKGEVKITWFSGQGSDANAQIFYSGGMAEVTIVGKCYIVSITLDTSKSPADSTVVFEEDKVLDLTALSTAYEGNTGRYEGIEIDATAGKFANNGSGWIQMNEGTVLKVNVSDEIVVGVVEYEDKGLIDISDRDEDGWVTLTATGNTYIKSISFTIERVYEKDEIINLLGLSTAYEGNTGSYLGIKIDATTGKFANNNSGWIQFNTGATLKIHVGEGIEVSVKEYEDKGLVDISDADEDGWVTITATGNTYISQIILEIPFVQITEDYTYTYAQGGRTDGTLEVGNDKIKFENCKVNNSWLAYGKITLNVAAGATITIQGSQYDKSVVVNDDTLTHKVEGNYWVYTYEVTEAGFVTISGNAYLASITVSFSAD